MAASNMITSERLNQVDNIITELSESAVAISHSQEHELASCFEYIDQLSQYEDGYMFW